MKWRSSIIYLVVLALLGGYYYYFEVVKKTRQEEADRQAKRVFQDLKVAGISAVEIDSKDKEPVQLNKKGVWEIIRPIACQADQAALEGLLSTLATLESERNVIADAQDLKPYGLADPALRMKIEQGDRSTELLLGDKNPSGDAYYAKVSGKGDVFLVSQGVWGVLHKGLDELRRRDLFSFEPDEVVSVRVNWEDGRRLLVERQKGQKEWSAPDHPELKIKTGKVQNVLDQLRWLRAQKFVEKEVVNLAGYGLAPPYATVQLQMGENRSVDLQLGKRTDEGKEIHAVSSELPAVVLIGADIVRTLPTDIHALQDRSFFTLKSSGITAVAWQLDGAAGRVERIDDNKWGWPRNGENPVELKDSWQVSSLLYDLAQAEYLQEIKPVPEVAAEPYGRLEFYGGDKKLASVFWDKPSPEAASPITIRIEQEGMPAYAVEVEAELIRRAEQDLRQLAQGKS